jgi:hypothetical protein
MHLANAPILLALFAAVLLCVKVPARLFPVIAVVASGLDTLRAFGLLSLKVPVVGGAFAFGVAMVVGGAGSWVKAPSKVTVTAATVVVLFGLSRVLARFI